jgi:hypothetical protein
VSETLSLSIFTIEADRKPLLAFAAKKYQEAEAFCADERVRTKLRSVSSDGVPQIGKEYVTSFDLMKNRLRYRGRSCNTSMVIRKAWDDWFNRLTALSKASPMKDRLRLFGRSVCHE